MRPSEIYRHLYRIRRVEEEIARVYSTDKIQSPVHLSIGQELASVAVCAALEPRDKVFGSYRGHALYLAKGGNLPAFVAELYGKVTGCAKGKGGSMHLVEPAAGLMGTSAIVASLIPVAVGYAWAQKLQKTGRVTAVFFGDGATEEGCYFEAMNLAALHRLPILFVCENNGYAIVTPLERRQSTPILERARAILGFQGAGTRAGDFDETMAAADFAVRHVREGEGPRFLEVVAPRLKEHVGPGEDWAQGYRDRPYTPRWKDPVIQATFFRGAAETDLARIRAEVESEIDAAFAFADASPMPGPEELYRDLYAA
jgi:TPP-dependent pyruvate/acetoin dehydrogenase alpha subunit